MTDHYREAERLLSDASFTDAAGDFWPVTREGVAMNPVVHASLIDRAQVHATLAQIDESRRPRRGDAVETWIRHHRDRYTEHTRAWTVLDDLLEAYRLGADTGVPLNPPAPVESVAKSQAMTAADLIGRTDQPLVVFETDDEPIRVLRAVEGPEFTELVSVTWQDIACHCPAVTVGVHRDVPVRLAGGAQ